MKALDRATEIRLYRVAQKVSNCLPMHQLIVSIKSWQMNPACKRRLFVNKVSNANAIILSLGIRYSMRDLICDVNFCS